MSSGYVFISYSSKNYYQANEIRQLLLNNGISCWMAPDSITYGSNYASAIPSAIRGCSVFLLLLSEAAQKSRWVTREVDVAVNNEKQIIPYMLEDCKITDVFDFYLIGYQRVDGFRNSENAMQQLIKLIRSQLQIDTEPTAPEPVTREPEIVVPEPAPVEASPKKDPYAIYGHTTYTKSPVPVQPLPKDPHHIICPVCQKVQRATREYCFECGSEFIKTSIPSIASEIEAPAYTTSDNFWVCSCGRTHTGTTPCVCGKLPVQKHSVAIVPIPQINGKERCPLCNTVQRANRSVCFQCGAPFTRSDTGKKTCIACGTELDPGSIFCPVCKWRQ